MGSRSLVIASTTLDWRSGNNRAASLDYIFSVLNTSSDVVLSGDFNFDVHSEPESAHLVPNYHECVSPRDAVL